MNSVKVEVEEFDRRHSRLFASGAPVLRAISPLAEGVDRLFAEAALGLKYELCCPMPFYQAEFEDDFSTAQGLEPDSLNRFRGLLARAERETSLRRFEMDGDRANSGEAYRACGHVVVNQSDLLLVVWDGERLEKVGGTEETFDEARHKGVPIVWIDAHAPHAWELVDVATPFRSPTGGSRFTPEPGEYVQKLRGAVRQALELPKPKVPTHAGAKPPVTTIDDFYAEQKRRVNPALLWKSFRDVVGDWRWPGVEFRVPDFEASVEGEWPRDQASAHGRVIDWLRPFYAWPDKLAVGYSDIYRSAFVLAYLLAGLAVGTALLPLAFGWNVFELHAEETVFVAVELLLIVVILLIIWRGRRRKWHERWIDYRLAAELVRHLRLGAPLGSGRPFPQVPAQWASYGDPGSTWMAWYVRAVERDLGLPAARLDVPHVSACVADLANVLEGQVKYHRLSADRSHRIEKRLHRFGLTLLSLTMAACAAHLLFGVGDFGTPAPWVLGSLIFLAGFLPALGAAVAGISNQGEFRRLAKRSDAMWARMKDLKAIADALEKRIRSTPRDPTVPGASREAAGLALSAAQLMVNEVLDWRVVFLDQPLKPS
ncbi:MAG TPA: hypothetical protein VES67_00925 [Vicinamibacterales bacterium]|nr:hypothetical protein [Vicinamibacterales bacterium]